MGWKTKIMMTILLLKFLDTVGFGDHILWCQGLLFSDRMCRNSDETWEIICGSRDSAQGSFTFSGSGQSRRLTFIFIESDIVK